MFKKIINEINVVPYVDNVGVISNLYGSHPGCTWFRYKSSKIELKK